MRKFITVGGPPPGPFTEALIPLLLAKAEEISEIQSDTVTFNLGGGLGVETVKIHFKLNVPQDEGEQWLTFVCTSYLGVQSNMTKFEEFVNDSTKSAAWPKELDSQADRPSVKAVSERLASENKRILKQLKAQPEKAAVVASSSAAGD